MPWVTPDTDNYRIGKGIVKFKPVGALVARDLGNVETIVFNPDEKRLDHFSSRGGVKRKDKSVTTEQGGTITIKCDEWVPENVALAVMGEVATDTAGDVNVDIYTVDEIEGELTFEAHNDVGPIVNMTLFRVSFRPAKAVDMISDGWSQFDLTCELLARESDGRFGFYNFPNP
jgi:hypothetical protein